jgi:hypothetical protein
MVVEDALATVQFTVDQDGKLTGVFLSVAAWQALMKALEDAEDLAMVRDMLPKLRQGPVLSGALRWEDIREEWLSEEEATPEGTTANATV